MYNSFACQFTYWPFFLLMLRRHLTSSHITERKVLKGRGALARFVVRSTKKREACLWLSPPARPKHDCICLWLHHHDHCDEIEKSCVKCDGVSTAVSSSKLTDIALYKTINCPFDFNSCYKLTSVQFVKGSSITRFHLIFLNAAKWFFLEDSIHLNIQHNCIVLMGTAKVILSPK